VNRRVGINPALVTCLLFILLTTAKGTFSIVAYDPETGDLGVAVQSKFFGVGSVVPWAESGIGAVATQARANVRFGPLGLKLMREGGAPEEIRKLLAEGDPGRDERQFLLIDAKGRTAAHTGKKCMEWAGHREGKNYAVAGNILAGEAVATAMAEAFEKARCNGEGELAEWLISALKAGQAAGGDKRGRQSAALLVLRKNGGYAGSSDRYVDLRVEDHETPIKALGRLLEKHRKFYGAPIRVRKANSPDN
jgi:uncharacterized Ntn-hydrolase superfamily protein